jgi:hypothetical protein
MARKTNPEGSRVVGGASMLSQLSQPATNTVANLPAPAGLVTITRMSLPLESGTEV